jgi:hypothetical protein
MIQIDLSDLIDIGELAAEVAEEALLEVATKVTLDVHTNLVTASPVDTGAFRGAWSAEVPTGPYANGVVSNSTEYGPKLMEGHSPQAEPGWVDAAVEAATRF